VRAIAIALLARSARIPQPSRTIKTTGEEDIVGL
jgi:hypothetical protein